MNAKHLLVGNWKMNLGPQQGRDLAVKLREYGTGLSRTEMWVAPPAVSIPAVAEALKGAPIRVGAQNAYWEDSGAFTGELAVPMLQEAGASFVIIGHSERRHVFGEQNDLVIQRGLRLLARGCTVIFCVGEKLEERESSRTNQVLEEQLLPVVSQMQLSQLKDLIIAYEPVWAIGTGKVATNKEIEEAHGFIDELCRGKLQGQSAPILYGGSVKPDNFAGIIQVPRVAGALVGGASIKFESFRDLAAIAEKA